jgi:hypothetical protein
MAGGDFASKRRTVPSELEGRYRYRPSKTPPKNDFAVGASGVRENVDHDAGAVKLANES